MYKVECLTVFSPFNSNCYFIRPTGKNETIIVDPGGDAELILEWIEKEKAIPEAIWLTHGHLDHLGAVAEILQQYSIPVFIHENEKDLCSNALLNGFTTYGLPYNPFKATTLWQDKQEFQALGSTWRIMLTPGHSPGSVCIINPESRIAFSGDLILGGSTGRTDLPGGNEKELFNSLRRLFTEEKGLTLYPGHYEPTTMEDELLFNHEVRYALSK